MKTTYLSLLITCVALPLASLATVASAKPSTAFGALAEKIKSLKKATSPLHLIVDRELQGSTCGEQPLRVGHTPPTRRRSQRFALNHHY